MEKIKDSEMGSFLFWGSGGVLVVIWGGNFKNYFCLFFARGPTHKYVCMYIHKTSPPTPTKPRASKQTDGGRKRENENVFILHFLSKST
jgi:hypothetical protein